MIPVLLAVATLVLPTPLRDSNGDGLIELSAQRGDFPAHSVLVLCPDEPPYTYALKGQCPATTDPKPPAITAQRVSGSWTATAPRSNAAIDIVGTAYNTTNGGKITIHDVSIGKGYGLLDHSKAKPATVDIRRVRMSCSRKCIVLYSESTGYLSDLTLSGTPGQDYEFAAGIQFAGYSHDYLIERVDIGGFRSTKPKAYPNADALSSEKSNYNITIRDSYFHDSTDACLDWKAQRSHLYNIRLARCGKNLRVHSALEATDLTSESPRLAHISIQSEALAPSASLVIHGRFTAIGGGTLFDVPKGQSLTFAPGSCIDLTRWTGIKKQSGTGTVVLAPPCS